MASPATFSMSSDAAKRVDEIIARYPRKLAAMLPVLWEVQRENGWIPPEGMEWVAERLACSPSTVQSVVTFYTMFDGEPVGKWKLQVCRTLSCELMGARKIVDHLRARLGIEPGETTSDGLFTLQEVECLASCGSAPMMQVNLKFCEHLTPERVDALLDELRAREPEWDDVVPLIHERPSPEEYRGMFPENGAKVS